MDFSGYGKELRSQQTEPLVVTESRVEETRLGLPPSVLAGMACVIPFVGAIGLGIAEKNQRFVVLYALQSLLFWIVAAIFFWFSGMIFEGDGFFSMLLQLILLIPLWVLGLALLFLLVLMSYRAFQGMEWYLPGLRRYLDPVLDKISGVGVVE